MGCHQGRDAPDGRPKRSELDSIEARRRREVASRSEAFSVGLVGYTNAGKSTLLNTLTHSKVEVEDKLFATLDPKSSRVRFPRERELILNDTVGFIHDLPADLVRAFADANRHAAPVRDSDARSGA